MKIEWWQLWVLVNICFTVGYVIGSRVATSKAIRHIQRNYRIREEVADDTM